MKKICIFGTGGFAREVYWLAQQCGREVDAFIDKQEGGYWYDVKVNDENYFDPTKHQAVVAIANPKIREQIVYRLINKHGLGIFTSLISPSANIMSTDNISIGVGVIICANCILTCDISLGDWSQLNLGTTIGHDTKISSFFTTAPGVNVSGKVLIGNRVYMGTNSSTIENLCIADDITIGAGACVTHDLLEGGTYVGIPAKKLERKNG